MNTVEFLSYKDLNDYRILIGIYILFSMIDIHSLINSSISMGKNEKDPITLWFYYNTIEFIYALNYPSRLHAFIT